MDRFGNLTLREQELIDEIQNHPLYLDNYEPTGIASGYGTGGGVPQLREIGLHGYDDNTDQR